MNAEPEFFEEDEDPAKVHAAFEAGVKGITAPTVPSSSWLIFNVLTGKLEPGMTNG